MLVEKLKAEHKVWIAVFNKACRTPTLKLPANDCYPALVSGNALG
jgi:hypothetical protein